MRNRCRDNIVDVVCILVYSFLLIAIFTGEEVEAAITCRSSSVKHQFDVQQGYPKGRKGYIVDHVCALANGGIDSPSNMQYQTPADSKAKDRVENTSIGKTLYCNKSNSTTTRQVFNCK